MAKRLRCYLRLHRWVEKVQAGELYYECRNCGRYRDPVRTGLICLVLGQKAKVTDCRRCR